MVGCSCIACTDCDIAARAARSAHPTIYLNIQILLDIDWWIEDLLLVNGLARIPEVVDVCDILLDATGDGSLGIFVDGAWLALSSRATRLFLACSDHPATGDANQWELYDFVVLLRMFGDYLRNKVITVVSDNMAAVGSLRKFVCKSANAVDSARILRVLCGLCVQYNVRLHTQWISRALNHSPHALSRCDEPGTWQTAARELQVYRASCGYTGRSEVMESMAIRPPSV